MTHFNFLRLFNECRLSPWIPEHDTFIRSRLAALEIEDPSSANNYRLKYANILADYYVNNPHLAIAELPPEVKESEGVTVEITEEPADVSDPIDGPKKRGRKPKIS